MRILDQDNDKKLNNILLFFTEQEASEMRDSLDILLAEKSGHHHINSEDYQKEITVCIYEENNLNSFNPRCKKLILEDE